MKEYHVLTEQEIADKLANMRVDTGEYLPIKMFSFIILNPEYNPDDFSEEIENSEEFINTLGLEIKEIHKPDFDFVWKKYWRRHMYTDSKRQSYASCLP